MFPLPCPPPSAPSWTDRRHPAQWLAEGGGRPELATGAKFSEAPVWHDAQVSLLITNIGELVTNAPPDDGWPDTGAPDAGAPDVGSPDGGAAGSGGARGSGTSGGGAAVGGQAGSGAFASVTDAALVI